MYEPIDSASPNQNSCQREGWGRAWPVKILPIPVAQQEVEWDPGPGLSHAGHHGLLPLKPTWHGRPRGVEWKGYQQHGILEVALHTDRCLLSHNVSEGQNGVTSCTQCLGWQTQLSHMMLGTISF